MNLVFYSLARDNLLYSTNKLRLDLILLCMYECKLHSFDFFFLTKSLDRIILDNSDESRYPCPITDLTRNGPAL